MFVRKSLAGAVTLAVTGSVLALGTGTAHAAVDNDDTTFTSTTADVIGVGSDTSQHALKLLADSYNAGLPAGAPRLASYAATSGGTIPLPSGAVTRPNGSGSGKSTLYNPSNPDVDFARSSSSLNPAETSAGLQQFPFALDTLRVAVSGSVTSHAPATLTPAQVVSIYKGETTNWSQVGGTDGAIAPKLPQGGSGTRTFFIAQLTAANGGVAFNPVGAEIQENDPTPIRNDANAIAPFSEGRSNLTPGALRLPTGFKADRALYNVIRNADLGNTTLQGLFGQSGFLCSDDANDLIKSAGFDQLDSVADGGVCGQSTQAATTNFKLNEPVVPIETTTTLTGTSPSAKALRLTAKVAGTPTPTGRVTFVDATNDKTLGAATLIGGTATLNLTNRAPGLYSVVASYEPTEDSAFVASSNAPRNVRVKAASSTTESFASAISRKATSAKGVVTVKFSGLTASPTGKVAIRKGTKVVGSGTLKAGKASITLSKRAVGTGKVKLTATWAGDSLGFGSSRAFYITFNK